MRQASSYLPTVRDLFYQHAAKFTYRAECRVDHTELMEGLITDRTQDIENMVREKLERQLAYEAARMSIPTLESFEDPLSHTRIYRAQMVVMSEEALLRLIDETYMEGQRRYGEVSMPPLSRKSPIGKYWP